MTGLAVVGVAVVVAGAAVVVAGAAVVVTGAAVVVGAAVVASSQANRPKTTNPSTNILRIFFNFFSSLFFSFVMDIVHTNPLYIIYGCCQ